MRDRQKQDQLFFTIALKAIDKLTGGLTDGHAYECNTLVVIQKPDKKRNKS